MGFRVVKQFAPGYTVVTDQGLLAHGSNWMSSLLSFSSCLFSLVYSSLLNLFIGSLLDSNLGTWKSSSHELVSAMAGDSHQQPQLESSLAEPGGNVNRDTFHGSRLGNSSPNVKCTLTLIQHFGS